jgi:hypothetical protein
MSSARDFLIAHRDVVSLTFGALGVAAAIFIAWCSGFDYGSRNARSK